MIEAENGEQGIRLAKEHIPDLILLDMQMPVISGFAAAKVLKSDPETKDIKVIAITSQAMKGDGRTLPGHFAPRMPGVFADSHEPFAVLYEAKP